MLPVAVARSPLTLCTSGFVDDVMFYTIGPMGQNQARRYVHKKFVRWRYQLDVKTTTMLGRVYQNAALGAKSVIYD